MTTTSIKALQARLSHGEAFLVASIPNRFYLTGFSSSDGFVLILPNKAVFLVDFRYIEKARQVVNSCEVYLSRSPLSEIQTLCAENGIHTLFLEAGHTSLSFYKRLQAALSPIALSDADTLEKALLEERAIKSREELAFIQAAQDLTDETFSYILSRLEAGRTEIEVMLDMEFYMRKHGSEGVSFDFIVVSGKNSSLPHGVPTDKKLEKGDFITMDFGAVINGYHADMTRTVALGYASDEQKQVYETVLQAQNTAFAHIRPGVVCRDVDAAARTQIDKAGYEGCFGHGLGHSVGVEIHESPCFNTRCETILRPGMLLTVEPGIYLENRFGVRIEDMVYITEEGFENLTHSPKKLYIV